MKNKILLLTLLISLIMPLGSMQAQSISCSDLSVEAVNQDTLDSGTLQISVRLDGPETNFINYPWVTALIDCNGDTVATGSMFWFGQLGQTTQEYPVSVLGTSTCQPMTVIFIYGNNMGEPDTCYLPFNTSGIDEEIQDFTFAVFPNPANDIVTIGYDSELPQMAYQITNISGQTMMTGELDAENHSVDVSTLPKGLYFFILNNEPKKALRFIKN